MAFGSGDYLYCSHSTCHRRFCSESALAKHYGSFHGRPTCQTCGKKLKKSGKHTCTLLDTSASLEDYPALDFASPSDDLDYGYDTETAEHVDIFSPPTFAAKDLQGTSAFSPSLNFDRFYRTQSSCPSLDNDDGDSSSCTPPITDDLSSGDCDSDSCEIWEDYGGLDEYADFYDDHRYDDGTKDESPLPFHIHLSLALKQLIGTSAVDDDDWNEDDSDYLGPTPKWFYSFYDDEHYFDREAESNDPSFLSRSLNTLWSPPTESVKVV
jgi:hypothetical protein